MWLRISMGCLAAVAKVTDRSTKRQCTMAPSKERNRYVWSSSHFAGTQGIVSRRASRSHMLRRGTRYQHLTVYACLQKSSKFSKKFSIFSDGASSQRLRVCRGPAWTPQRIAISAIKEWSALAGCRIQQWLPGITTTPVLHTGKALVTILLP